MRVALVVTGGVDRSGTTRVIPSLLALVARLARAHDVHVFVLQYLDQPCSYPLLGATVHDLGRPVGLMRQYMALVDALRREGPFDVLHAMWALPAGVVAGLAGRRLGVPVVMTADSGEFVALPAIEYGLQRGWRHRAAVRAAMALASRVTVCTRFMAGLARQCGCDAEIVPLGVDRATFRPGGAAPDASAAADGPPWRLLHVASLSRVKDQATLLRAFRYALDTLAPAEAHLDVVGEDTLGGEVQALARDLGLDHVVTFHGVLPTASVVPLYQAAHLVVISSRHEAASAVALEASSAGVPLVGTRVGYLHDWPEEMACSVPVGDAAGLGAAIVNLIADPARRGAMSRAARQWAITHDADWTAARVAAIYDELHVTPRGGSGHPVR